MISLRRRAKFLNNMARFGPEGVGARLGELAVDARGFLACSQGEACADKR
jgi:hypothetical protein